jgi:hypothetical protein
MLEEYARTPAKKFKSLVKRLRAILWCRRVGGKLIYSGYGSNRQNTGFGTSPMG